MTVATRNTRISPRRMVTRAPGQFTTPTKTTKRGQRPEWTTERWAHRVEAEARRQLKHEVRDVGAAHR